MNSKLLVIFLIPFILTVKDAKIPWSNEHRLEWYYFQGLPPKEKGAKEAVSSVQIEIEGDFYENEIPKVKIIAYFLKNTSWTITSDSVTLAHEQLHFDIAELYARKTRKDFACLVKNNNRDYKVYYSKYYEKIDGHKKAQKKYDNEVYFNKSKQLKWNDSIKKELNKLKEYEYIPEK